VEETGAADQLLDSGARGKGPERLIEELLRQTMQCDGTDKMAVVEHQAADGDIAQAARFFEDYIVDLREVTG
jgi:hypothetical protein